MKKTLIGAALLAVALHALAAVAVALPDFTKLAEQYSPAVVNISTTRAVGDGERPNVPGMPDDHPLNDLFRKFFENQREFPWPERYDEQSMGSGFIVSPDGDVVTNAHVVEGVDEILVRLYDRRELRAEVVGLDEQSDIALLKIEAEDLPTVTLGSSKDLKVGEWVMAIGNPFGFGHTVTAGIVSAKGRSFFDENYVPFIQTDVAINPGNSGGPLFNARGEVVGVNSRISSEPGRRSYAGLSFAIPAEVAENVVRQLKEKGRVSRGWLGVLIQDITPDLVRPFGLEKPGGALVAQVLPDSPAESGGIEVGDVILEFDGAALKTSSDLPPLVGNLQAGRVATVKVMRDGRAREFNIKIGELPDERPAFSRDAEAPAPQEPEMTSRRLGLDLEDLSEEIKARAEVEAGAVITAIHDGPAREFGLQVGDIILSIDSQKITDVATLNQIVATLKPGRSVAVLIQRQAAPMFLAMRIPQDR